jgi:hypothetical protein
MLCSKTNQELRVILAELAVHRGYCDQNDFLSSFYRFIWTTRLRCIHREDRYVR